ncbi:MAG: hypothetical protein ACTMIR_05890 [Cellulomonadaceae bacterium]
MSSWTVVDWVLACGITVAALTISAVVGAVVSPLVLRLAERSPDSTTPTPTPTPTQGDTQPDNLPTPAEPGPPTRAARRDSISAAAEVLRGGRWIGVLERLAVTVSLIAGYPAAIAVVVAVKGLGRYPEIRSNPGTSERFVIGTLTSMLWAAAIGIAARVALDLL